MANFNFKLERVLNYKKTFEDYKKGKYGTVHKKLIEEENELDRFYKYKKSLMDEKKLSSTKIKAGDLALYNNYINKLNVQIKNQEEIIIETKNELEEAKKEMITAVKEKKIFEKLKENEYEEYLYQLKKQEEKQNDTLLSFKAATQ